MCEALAMIVLLGYATGEKYCYGCKVKECSHYFLFQLKRTYKVAEQLLLAQLWVVPPVNTIIDETSGFTNPLSG